MTVELTRDTAVRLEKGTVLTVADAEGKRLIAFGLAAEKKESKAKKPAKK